MTLRALALRMRCSRCGGPKAAEGIGGREAERCAEESALTFALSPQLISSGFLCVASRSLSDEHQECRQNAAENASDKNAEPESYPEP
jgi:hypothetical protein